jgi:hypothetical protein
MIHDGESYQMMMINAVYSKHAGKMTKFNYMQIFRKISAHFQKVTKSVHSNCARFKECQLEGVGGVDYTISIKDSRPSPFYKLDALCATRPININKES